MRKQSQGLMAVRVPRCGALLFLLMIMLSSSVGYGFAFNAAFWNGTKTGTTCLSILNTYGTVSDGIYWLDPDGPNAGSDGFYAYCDMTRDGGGWTLVMRMAADTVLTYDSSYWTDQTTFNSDAGSSLHPAVDANAKFASFLSVRGTQLRGCKGDHTGNCLYMALSTSQTAVTLFNGGGQYGAGTLTRANLENVFGAVSFPYCNMIGTNQTIGSIYGRVRFGVLVNNENECASPDQVVGWGGKISNGVSCGAGRGNWSVTGNTCYQGSLWIR